MGEVEDGAGALIEHIGIEAFRPQQRDVALETLLDLLQSGELPFKHLLPALETGTGLKTVLADLDMIGEIAAEPEREQRKEKGAKPHGVPREKASVEDRAGGLSAGYFCRRSTDAPA